MATSTPSLLWANTTDTTFRSWGSGIHNALAAIGLVNTADTGQANWATVTKPVGTDTIKCYEIWRLNDALQATAPVFIKFEFGLSGGGVLGIMISAGTGTDGAGNLTGAGARLWASNSAGDDSGANTCYFSGDTDRFIFTLIHGTAAQSPVWFLERLVNDSGVSTGEGIVYGCGCGNPVITLSTVVYATGSQVIEFGKAVPPYRAQGHGILPPGASGINTTVPTTNSLGADVYMLPYVPVGYRAWNPLRQVWGYLNGDTASMVPYNSTVYGTSRSMLPLGAKQMVNGSSVALRWSSGAQETNVRWAIANY